MPGDNDDDHHHSTHTRKPARTAQSPPPHISPLLAPGSSTSSPRTPPATHLTVDPTEGHSDVSRPPPPPRLYRLSECIDPETLPMDYNVRDPQGRIMAPEQFFTRTDRPKSLRERQEEIRRGVVRKMSSSAVGESSAMGREGVEDAGSGEGAGKRKEGEGGEGIELRSSSLPSGEVAGSGLERGDLEGGSGVSPGADGGSAVRKEKKGKKWCPCF